MGQNTHKIVLNITNSHNKHYPSILMHKFFNMVFIGADGKSLVIYTATVFGGGKNTVEYGLQPEQYLHESTKCQLEFGYEYSLIDALDKDSPEKAQQIPCIKFENLTKSFLEQPAMINKVWATVKQLRNQETVSNALCQFYERYRKMESGKVPVPSMVNKSAPVLAIQDAKGRKCMAASGDFNETDDNHAYTLTVAEDIPEICAVNWIRTTIKLPKKQRYLEDFFEFEIRFSKECQYYTPDFTSYFTAPLNYTVDTHNAILTLGKDTSKEPGRVKPVSDATTVTFQEWMNDEDIDRKAKCRVIKLSKENLSQHGCISVVFGLTNPEQHGNTQFFIGIIVSFLLSYFSDQSCIVEYAENAQALCAANPCYFPNFCKCLSIPFALMIGLSFVSCLLRTKRCFPKKRTLLHRLLSLSKWVGLVANAALIFYIDIYWYAFPAFAAATVSSCRNNQWILFSLMFLSVTSSALFVWYCTCKMHNKIIDFM